MHIPPTKSGPKIFNCLTLEAVALGGAARVNGETIAEPRTIDG